MIYLNFAQDLLDDIELRLIFHRAEGKGRDSKKEFVQFLYYAKGSLFETITLLVILNQMNWIDDKIFQSIRTDGGDIGKMISSLIKSIKNSTP